MQPSPSFTVEIRRFVAWRVVVVSIAALALASLGLWCLSGARPQAVGALGALLAASVVAAAASLLLSVGPVRLHWDGRDWQLIPLRPATHAAPYVGRLDVALDLGSWMLLRFEVAGGAFRPRVRWVPVARRGLESAWHGLRCAVYSSRPAHDGFADTAS
jgi:hypothetical protein